MAFGGKQVEWFFVVKRIRVLVFSIRGIFIVGCWTLHGLLYGADIIWTPDKIIIAASEKESLASAVFKYENLSKEELVIRAVETSCGCTSADVTQRRIAPGVKGELRVKVSVEPDKTEHEETISVFFEGRQEPKVLRLAIGSTIRIFAQPRIVVWRKGDPITPKSMKLSWKAGVAAQIRAVKYDSNEVNVTWNRSKDHYIINVEPRTTKKAFNLKIDVILDGVNGSENSSRHYQLFASVVE